jgi:hypothetical protein
MAVPTRDCSSSQQAAWRHDMRPARRRGGSVAPPPMRLDARTMDELRPRLGARCSLAAAKQVAALLVYVGPRGACRRVRGRQNRHHL